MTAPNPRRGGWESGDLTIDDLPPWPETLTRRRDDDSEGDDD